MCMRSRFGAAIWRGWRSSGYILITALTPFSRLNLACLDGKLRWQEFLSRFHFEWKFIQGAKNMADPLSRRPVTNTPTGVCRQQLSLLVVTRGQARLLDASSAPPAVPVVTSNQGTTATAGPTAQQGNGGDRPSSAEPLSTDKPDCSPPDNALPTMHAWKDRLVAAYATDPWFCDVNTSSLFLDEGLWYNADGRMVIPDVDGIRRQLLSDFHDESLCWPHWNQ